MFSKVPQKILWRVEYPEKIKVPNNVQIVKWLPQRGILGELINISNTFCINKCGNNNQQYSLLLSEFEFT